MKVSEVEDLTRETERKCRELLSQLSPTLVVSNLKGTGVRLPREVAATVQELTQIAGEELGDVDVESFNRDIASLQVGDRWACDRNTASLLAIGASSPHDGQRQRK